MARGQRPPGGQGNRLRRGGSAVRRAWPVVMMAWERWQALPEQDKERYRRQAREAAQRGRRALEQARRRRGR
jgi:hypothetical protein